MRTKSNVLQPTTQKICNDIVFSVDVETISKTAEVVSIAFQSEDLKKTFWNKRDFINYLKSNEFKSYVKKRNVIIMITNIGFDFGVIFQHEPEFDEMIIFKPKSIIYSVTTWIVNDEYRNFRPAKGEKGIQIQFRDTSNYSMGSVKSMGKSIGIPKLESKSMGRRPKNEKEKEELELYNQRDAEITLKATLGYKKDIESEGGNFGLTNSSVSMSIFTSRFLKEKIYQLPLEKIKFLFKGYFGGRVEFSQRGLHNLELYNMYDFVSMYPSVMRDAKSDIGNEEAYPYPNSARYFTSNNAYYLKNFEGMTEVEIEVPQNLFPMFAPLPYRWKNKNVYATGTFRGVWSNVLLRYCIKKGCVVKEVFEGIYFTKTWNPFKAYINIFFPKKQKAKAEGNPSASTYKNLCNGFYGKFAQKFDGTKEIIPLNKLPKGWQETDTPYVELAGCVEFHYPESQPEKFCHPELASYVTDLARIKQFESLTDKTIYMDTDSQITTGKFETSPELGCYELEKVFKEVMIVRKKTYAGLCDFSSPDYAKEKEKVRAKGLPRKIKVDNKYVEIDYKLFKEKFSEENPKFEFETVTKFRQGLLSNSNIGSFFDSEKNLSVEDTSRDWFEKKFNPFEIQKSKPLHIVNDVISKPFENEKEIISTKSILPSKDLLTDDFIVANYNIIDE